MIIGIFLIFGLFLDGTINITISLLIFFIIILSQAVFRGIDVHCGCFKTEADAGTTDLRLELIKRIGEDNFDVTLIRDKIPINSVLASFLYDDNWRRIYPSAAISQNNSNVIYVSYMALSDTTTTNFNYDIFVQRSTDGGKNWEMPINITETDQFGEDEVYPQLASIANDEEAYIIFQSPDYNLITVDPPSDQADFMNRIYFAKVNFEPLSTDKVEARPKRIQVSPNYPNPFNPVTTIDFSLDSSTEIFLKIYDLLGNEVASLAEGFFPSGTHSIVWNASNFPAGIYICKISSDYITYTQKMILLK